MQLCSVATPKNSSGHFNDGIAKMQFGIWGDNGRKLSQKQIYQHKVDR